MSRDLYRDLVYRIAEEEGVYGPLAEAVIQQESNWDPAATSHAGAQGLMQLMPGTASDLGVEDPLDPEQNIRGGVRYLRQNLEKYNNDIDLALAAYNAGPGNVDKYGGIPPFKETQDYVSRIRGERLPMFMSEYGDFEETSEEEVSAGVDPAGLQDQVVEEEVETRTVFLPDNTWVDAPADMPEEEALQLAREKYPESFNVVGVEIPRGESNSWDAAAAAASRSTFGLIPGLQAAFASATGNEDLYDHAQGRLREESEAAYDIAPNLVTTEEIGKVYDEEGLIPAASKAMEFGTEQIFQSFGFQAPSIAAGLGVAGAAKLGVLAGLTGPVGVATAGMLAGLGTMFSTFLSENLERSYEEGKIDTKDVNLLRQAAAAGGQTALNSLTYLLVGGKVGTKMLLSPAAREEGFSALGKTLNRLEDLSPVKRMLAVVAEEEVAEIGQQALERYAAGLPVDPRHKGAAEEYAEIALATLAPSLGFAALGGVSSSLSRRAAERKDLDKETDVKKAMMERVTEARLKLEENRRSDALHNLRESAQYQAERDLFLSEAEDLAGITAEDIHALAKERNINSEDVAFHEFSRKATAGIEDKTGKKGGQAYLDGMSPKQLQKMYADIKAMPVQEQPTSLQVVSEQDARSFAGALAKGRKKQKVTKKQVEAKLRALGKIDEGQMEENFLGDLADQYIFRLAEFGLGTKLDDGSIQLKKTDRTLVSESDYQKIMDASRADAGGRFITMGRAKELAGVRGFNRYRAIRDEAIRRGDIVKTGKRYMVAPAKEFTKSFSYRIDEGPQHVVRNDRGEVESTHANQRAANNEKNKLARKIGYIARDEGGNAIGGAGTKQEARQHLSRYFARLRQEAKNAVLNNGVGKLPPIDQASDWIKPTVERRAEEAGEAAVRRAKDNVVGVKPIRRVYTVAKEDGFLIREEKTGADGRVSRSARKDFLAGEEEARARLSELEGRRVGGEAIGGRPVRGEEAELVRTLREDPATPLDEELPLPAPEQVSEHAALEEELNKVLTSRGLSEFRTEIVEGLNEAARVDPLTLTIQIAMTPGLQSKKIEDQVKALMPLLNHESIHAFRKMGLITKAEWKQLKKWAKTTPVPSEIVNAFNEKQTAAGLETLPDGATYYDMSRVLYADQGNADNWIDDSYVEEAVAFLGQDLTNIAPDPEVKGIFRKIASVLKRVGRALMGRGYRTPKEAFDKLYGPQMVQRAKAGRSLDTWWTDRRLGNDQIRPEYEFAELAGWAESRGRVLGGEQTTEEKVLEAVDSVESPDVDVSPGRAAVPRAAEGAGRPVESVLDEYGEIDEAIDTAAHALARDADMGITRDRDLSSVVRDENGEVIGAQWRSFDGDNYEFDVVVAPEHQGSGVGRSLIDDGIAGFDDHLEFNPDATMRLSVTSDVSEAALSRRGFEVVGGDNRIKVMERTPRAAEEGDRQFAQDRPSRRVGRAAVDRTRQSVHDMGVDRSDRVVASEVSISDSEMADIERNAVELGIPVKEIVSYVEKQKKLHPESDGWVPWVYSRTKLDDSSGKISHIPKHVPYLFDRDPSTVTDRNRWGKAYSGSARLDAVKSLGSALRDEVRRVVRRYESGDPAAETQLRQMGWYRNMRDNLRLQFGGLGDLFADLLGATSPNTGVRQNWDSAVEALSLAMRGEYDSLVPKWVEWERSVVDKENEFQDWVDSERAKGKTRKEAEATHRIKEFKKRKGNLDNYDALLEEKIQREMARPRPLASLKETKEYEERSEELSSIRQMPSSIAPRKSNGALFQINSPLVARSLLGLWREVSPKGAAPKAINFSGNLIGYKDKATVDVWAARLLQRLSRGTQIPSSVEGAVQGEMFPVGHKKLVDFKDSYAPTRGEDFQTIGQFRFAQEVFADAVDKIRSDPELSNFVMEDSQGREYRLSEINDDDLQAIAWFVEKEIWGRNSWTTAEGEGGSFEQEQMYSGSPHQERIKDLRKIIGAKRSTPSEKAAAVEDLKDLERMADRFTGGFSGETASYLQGFDYSPSDLMTESLAAKISSAIYDGDPDGVKILGSRVRPNVGQYGGETESSLDVEFVVREGYDASTPMNEIVSLARDADQDSVFLSRVLRADEEIDPMVHRPSVEVYFKNKKPFVESSDLLKFIEDVQAEFLGEGMSGFSVIVDPRVSQGSSPGSMPDVVGIRAQYIPEFDVRYDDSGVNKFDGMSDIEVADAVSEQYKKLEKIARKISENSDVTFSNVLWNETDVAFSNEYDGRLEGYEGDRVLGESGVGAREGAWRGRSIREGAAAAARQRQEADAGRLGIQREGGSLLSRSEQGLVGRVGRAAMSRGIPRGAENPVLRPGTDGQVTLANARWGQIPFNKEGKFDKRGVAYDIFVKEGYDKSVEGKSGGFGERHIERHNPDIRDNTPFRDWKELLSEFTKALSKGKKLRSGDIYPAPDGAGRMSFLWDRDDFKEPVVVVMEYVDTEDGESLPPKAHHYSVVTAFASDDYGGNVPDGNRRNNTPLHGSRVSTEAMKAYRRPSVARKWNEKQRGRFALNRTDGVPYTPAQRAAQADLNGGIPETDNSLWGQVSSAFPVIDTAFWSEMRRRFLEKFNRLKEIGEMRGARGDTVGSLASSSAWALAMMVDRAGAFLSASFKYGVMTFRDGIPMVEDLELTNTAENVLIYNTRTGEYERVTKSVPNMYEGVGGLLPILEALAVPGRNLVPKFFAYSRALRGYNLMQAGKLVPFENPEESIKQGLAFADEHPEIAIAHANLQKWNEGMVEFLVQTGVMTRDMADVWLQHSDYVPFYLNLDGETNDAMRQIFTEQLGEGADFQILDSLVSGIPSKRYKGFKGQLMEPVEALSKNAFALIQAGLKNVASAKAIDEAMDIAEPMARETTKDKSDFTVRREGKEYYYAVSDPVLLNTLMGAFEGTNPVIEAFGAPARWLREAVTRSPEFMAANMLRDSLSTWVISGGKAGPWDTLSTFGKDLKNWKIGETSETLKILEKTGAIGGYDLQGTSPKALKRYFLKASGAKSGGPMGLGSKLWGDLGDISGLSEAAARQRVYEHVYEITMDKLAAENIRGEKAERIAMREAGFQAQEVLNFSRRGSSPWLKVITATVPFLNARLQGLDRLGRSAFGQDSMVGMSREEAIRSFILRGSLIAGMTIAYTLMNWEDEEYQNTRQEIRDDNWLIPTGTGNFISIPIPFEVGVLFKVIPEMLTAAALGRAPRELVDSARHALVNTLNFNPLPQAVKPIIEGWTNYNFFTGREIVPFYMEDMISEKQYRPTTTAPAKMLGAAFNVSPMKVENFIRGQFGTIGSYAMSATDAVLHNPAFGYTSRPDRRLTDFPFFRRFMKDEFGTGNKSLYYDMRGEVDGIVATINALSKTEPMEAMKIRREYGGLLRMRDVVNSMDKQMRSLRNRRIQIYVNPSMDPGMKRKLIDNLDRTENRLLKNVPAMRKMADLGIF